MSEDHTDRLEAALVDRYRIERQLGEGGMATVYLAEDLKHTRKVALKVLKPELAAVVGAERFLAEIKTTANLQHPHILPLFDSGEADKLLFYAMPFVQGESLRERLDREHQLPVDEAARIATNVAEALDYAHRHGVIHRDIKPANVLLLDGKPVISDFGIALAVTGGGKGRLTETGLSLGTPHYMSPEQATGDQHVGPATDIWALGCVLYEMLVGEPPYTGSTPQAVLGKIVLAEPASATEARRSVPAHMDAAVRKALEKLPADRFGSAAEFAKALADPAFRHGEGAVARTAGVRAGGWTRQAVALAGVAAVASALAAWGWLRPATETARAEVTRLAISLPEDAPLEFQLRYPDLAISRDGRTVAYKGSSPEGGARLYVRDLASNEVTPLRGAELGVAPEFSPDGAWIAFVDATDLGTNRFLRKVSVLGGAPVTLVEMDRPITNMSWGEDDRIVFGTGSSGLFRIPASGGSPEQLTTIDASRGEQAHRAPSVVEGRGAVFWIQSTDVPLESGGELAALDFESGVVTRLGLRGMNPRYIPTGHLIYASGDGSLRGVPFDPKALQVTGAEVPLVEGVYVKATGNADFDVSDYGVLVYASGTAGAGGGVRSVVWVDRETGTEQPIPAEPADYVYPRLSPDAHRLALDQANAGPIWLMDMTTGTRALLTVETGGYGYPTWTSNGQRIAYQGPEPTDISWRAASISDAPEVLATPRSAGAATSDPYFFALGDSALVFRDQAHPATDDDLAMISLETDSVLWRLNEPYIERNAELSPNGRWMAYQSNESGTFQVYVRPFPDVASDRTQVSDAGGIYPLWSRDGQELFYLMPRPGARHQLISVSVNSNAALASAFGERRTLMDWPYHATSEGRPYDVDLDGQRFVAIKVAGVGATTREIHVVLNWFEEVRQRMGAR